MKRVLIFTITIFLLSGCAGNTTGTIYEDDFEKGYVKDWTGGEVQSQYSYAGSKYALKGIPGSGGFLPLEIWKKFSVNENTKLSFAYYCDYADNIIVNVWCNKHKKNYSLTIRRPASRKWMVFTEEMAAFGPDIGGSINSIHISVPNRNNPLFVVDNVRLYNE